ncbi:MAG: general secretion pathway protein GspB [Pseudomonadales bacterium]|nr:general secretion pathway protein GspB [Pseudomonadales bacterium]
MSYILDALRKSEQERRQGEIPDLVHGQLILARKTRGTPWWAWLILALLLVNLLAFTGWFLTRYLSPATEPVSVSQSAIKPPAQNPRDDFALEIDPLARSREVSNTIVAESNVPDNAAPYNDIIKNNITNNNVANNNVTDKNVSGNIPAQSAPPVDVSQGPLQLSEVIDAPETTANQDTAFSEPEPEPEPMVTEPMVTETRPAEPPAIESLDPGDRKRIPQLIFNSHIYSPENGASRVMINNIYLREGQAFQGMKLTRITEFGAEFSLGEIDFKLAALRDWRPGK